MCLLGAAACLDGPVFDPFGNRLHDPSLESVWTIILNDDSGRVWIAQSDTAVPLHGARDVETVPAQLWVGLDGDPAGRDLVLWLHRQDDQLDWRLESQGLPAAWGRAPLTSDARYWVPRSRGRGTLSWAGEMRSVTFDVIGGMPMPTKPVIDPIPPASVVVQTPGIVSLRLDDCAATDDGAFSVLQRLGLVAEFAVPSAFVGQPGSCSEDLLRAIYTAGNTVESHSRLHETPPVNFGDFYLETVGSASDLRARGYSPHDFIQPGPWHTGISGDPTDFDNPAKLRTPYGALLRRVYVALEAYLQVSQRPLFPVTGRIGPSSLLLRRLQPGQVDTLVRAAASDGRWIQFMWHSWELSPASLTDRLAVIAALRDSGLVTVLPYYAALHATRASVP